MNGDNRSAVQNDVEARQAAPLYFDGLPTDTVVFRAAGPPPAHQVEVAVADDLVDAADWRATFRQWVSSVCSGGRLLVRIPAEAGKPSARWPHGFTVATLADCIVEALLPGTYRIEWIATVADHGFLDPVRDSQALSQPEQPGIERLTGHAALIEPLTLDQTVADESPIVLAEPAEAVVDHRLRIERVATPPSHRIVLLKLDHLGDFMLGWQACREMREAFPDAEITVVVGSWNGELAVASELFDHVVSCDVFPRNASEADVDLAGKGWMLAAGLTGRYDLAVDLRVDPDTRFLLASIDASVRAGIGAKIAHPFLDIFLPIDASRGEAEAAWDEHLPARMFLSRLHDRRTQYVIDYRSSGLLPRPGVLVWGPYRKLPMGDYRFEPFIEIDRSPLSSLRYDIVVNDEAKARGIPEEGTIDDFTCQVNGGAFEFRLFAPKSKRLAPFRFYGGRLVKRGSAGVLHQSEYPRLLVALVVMRLSDGGMLIDTRVDQ